MEFNIRKGASEPVLKLRLIDDGKNDKSSFNDMLENSEISFSMYRYPNGEPVILNASCYLTLRTKKFNNITDEYYIVYKFTEEDTMNVGKFEGIITVQFYDENSTPKNKLILPLQEKLFINVF